MTSKQLLDAAEVLRLSAEAIKTGGWTTGAMHHPAYGHCAIGAIGLAATGAEVEHVVPIRDQLDQRTYAAIVALVDFLHEKPKEWSFEDVEYEMDVREWPLDAVMLWNDQCIDSRARVIEAMLKAADWAASRAVVSA